MGLGLDNNIFQPGLNQTPTTSHNRRWEQFHGILCGARSKKPLLICYGPHNDNLDDMCRTRLTDNSHAKDDIEIFFLIRPHSESFIVLTLSSYWSTGCTILAAHGSVIGITVRMVGVKAAKLQSVI